VRELRATSTGVTAATPRGAVTIVDAAAFRSHFGSEPPDISQGPRLAAMQFRVRDRAALAAALKAGGIASSAHMDAIIVAPEHAMGATLAFT
jgi:hypothetical protein